MAKDGLGTIITLGVLGVGGYYLYSSGLLASLFGSSPATTTPPATTPPAGGTNPVPVTPPACSPTGALAKILALAQKANPTKSLGPNGTDTFTIDEWQYYGNQYCTNAFDQWGINADSLFPGRDDRGGQLNWNALVGYATQHGVSGFGAAPRRRRGVRRARLIGTNLVRRAA